MCESAMRGGLGVTLFERIAALHPQATSMLTVQYRMHAHISDWALQVTSLPVPPSCCNTIFNQMKKKINATLKKACFYVSDLRERAREAARVLPICLSSFSRNGKNKI